MSPFRKFAVGVAAAVVVVLTTAVPASAHDELVSSTPAVDDRLETAPTGLSLEFSADVMELGALIMVADGAGGDWADGTPTVDRTSVTIPVTEGMPSGGYEVRWRVVSADGHPISGVIPFTVGDGEPLVREPAAADGAEVDAGAGNDAQASQNAQDMGGIPRVVVIGGIGAAVAVAVFAPILLLRRRHAAGTSSPEQ
ncbi:methionine-rich copper-binding protein CopC [Microbacterium marinum]|uniref:Methionine-rich copper-binding protein CopC n=1 Tax=Microbacterium marinum TaxID=421115 RepID=A0A7W7BPT5_9MICO|nr:copper resistance CopC family protein [Microbacterium marinum]MBB4666582.1 methionine-rich copper-binding protein CopC [Microbacterium marinum]